MLVSAAQVADTLRLLIPGFVLMKIFYQFGLPTKRTDAQWVLWSLLAAVPVNLVASAIHPASDGAQFWIAIAIAVAAGALFVLLWSRIAKRWPLLAADLKIRAWDVVLGSPKGRWLQVELTDHRVYSGRPKHVAQSVDADDLDLYLAEPKGVVGDDYVDLPGVDGILIPRSQVSLVYVVR